MTKDWLDMWAKGSAGAGSHRADSDDNGTADRRRAGRRRFVKGAAITVAAAATAGYVKPDFSELGVPVALAVSGPPICQPPLLDCKGTCIDPRTDPQNCGACGKVCPSGTECLDGQCVTVGVCTADFTCGQSLGLCKGDFSSPLLEICACFSQVGPAAKRCGNNFFCNSSHACTSTADCETEFGPGFYCGSSCCGQTCIPPCGSLMPGDRPVPTTFSRTLSSTMEKTAIGTSAPKP